MIASSKKGLETEYVAKKDGSDNPVDICKGWFDPCEYCDKRFGEWISVDEDVYEKIPEKPGFFMVALKNKNITEVVSISYHQENIQKVAIPEMDKIKDQVSNRKMKTTKSAMLVRWMVLKKVGEKDSVLLCCHWNNNGVLPKHQTSWPGQSLMGESEVVFFSTQIQKWCYKQKNPVWKKEKAPPIKNTEEVQKCNFQKCDICDSFFTSWKPISEVIEEDLAPNENGLVMLSVVYGKKREILDFCSMGDAIVTPIKSTVIGYEKSEGRYIKKFANKNATLQVRWAVIKNINSDDSCFLFAHFHNAEEWPTTIEHYKRFNGESALNRNKNFVFRQNDKKWWYVTETFKTSKSRKVKGRKELFDQLDAEENYEMDQS